VTSFSFHMVPSEFGGWGNFSCWHESSRVQFGASQISCNSLASIRLVRSQTQQSTVFLTLNLCHYSCSHAYFSLNKKFWEELIAYFPLIRHGPHRKRRLQQLFVAAETCSHSHCLAVIGVHTDRPIDSPFMRHGPHRKRRFQQFFVISCITCRGNVSTEPFPSNDRGGYT
jgi:hypothetical protein